jgi:hypothetical protein
MRIWRDVDVRRKPAAACCGTWTYFFSGIGAELVSSSSCGRLLEHSAQTQLRRKAQSPWNPEGRAPCRFAEVPDMIYMAMGMLVDSSWIRYES